MRRSRRLRPGHRLLLRVGNFAQLVTHLAKLTVCSLWSHQRSRQQSRRWSRQRSWQQYTPTVRPEDPLGYASLGRIPLTSFASTSTLSDAAISSIFCCISSSWRRTLLTASCSSESSARRGRYRVWEEEWEWVIDVGCGHLWCCKSKPLISQLLCELADPCLVALELPSGGGGGGGNRGVGRG